MTGIRTDLAQEAHQLHRDVEGVECRDETCHGYEAHVVQVRTHAAAQVLGKPIGPDVTVELDGLLRREEAGFSRAVEAIAGLLAPMLPTKGLALVVGLGNRAMTPDLVGPRAVDFTLVTRHLVEALPQFSHLRAVGGRPARGGCPPPGCGKTPYTGRARAPTASSRPAGPPPLICRVTVSRLPLSMAPIMAAAVSRRPSAAVVTALVLCRRSISRTMSVESMP